MLPRPVHRHLASIDPIADQDLFAPMYAGCASREQVSALAKRWLHGKGSLTARLRAHGTVTVTVTAQATLKLWPQEQQAIRTQQGHVREVILSVDGRPAVWARSVTPLNAVKGPWQAMKGLGTRPLAELLFARRHVVRTPLCCEHLPLHGQRHQHIAHAWRKFGALPHEPAPAWCRHSVFWHAGAPLQVMECIADWVFDLSTHR